MQRSLTVQDELGRLRIGYMRTLALVSMGLGFVSLLTTLFGRNQTEPLFLILFVLANGLWLIALSRRMFGVAAYGMLATFVAASLASVLGDRFQFMAILALITAAILARRDIYLLTNTLVLGKLAIAAMLMVRDNPGTLNAGFNVIVVPLITLGFISIVTRYFVDGAERAIATSRINTDLLQAATDVGQVIAQILDQDELLRSAVELIRDHFHHYHVQVFLVNDARDQAILVASTGEVGALLLEREHQLSVGSQSVIGQVILRGSTVLVNDTERSPVYFPNPLLLNTRAELALPIRDDNKTIGALDIQSTSANAFNKTDLQALQVVADLLATSIRNARLLRQRAQLRRENDRLTQEALTNRREIERLTQELTHMAWQNYQTDSRAVTGITLEHDRITPGNDWSQSLARAGREGRSVESGVDNRTVAVPVTLRGEVIGAIEVEPGQETSSETLEMVQAVAQRLALSLENARLYEESLQAASQEQRINDIAARFQSVATVDELLRITLSELSESLGAARGSIRLARFEQPASAANGSGSGEHTP